MPGSKSQHARKLSNSRIAGRQDQSCVKPPSHPETPLAAIGEEGVVAECLPCILKVLFLNHSDTIFLGPANREVIGRFRKK